MSADQIAGIAPFVREVFDYARQNPAAKKELCATYDVAGVNGAWAQVTARELNFAYPREISPEEELKHIVQGLRSAKLISWEPGRYATWSYDSTDVRAVASVVDQILAHLFQLGDYSLDAQLEHL